MPEGESVPRGDNASRGEESEEFRQFKEKCEREKAKEIAKIAAELKEKEAQVLPFITQILLFSEKQTKQMWFSWNRIQVLHQHMKTSMVCAFKSVILLFRSQSSLLLYIKPQIKACYWFWRLRICDERP